MRTLLEALRAETGPLHQALHHHPVMRACQQGGLDRGGYVRMLRAFDRSWSGLRPQIASVPWAPLRSALQGRARALRDDLEALDGVEAVEADAVVDLVPDPGAWLGESYVLVGSSLGARQLQDSVRGALGADVPMSYLSMSPRAAGWPRLVARLRSLSAVDYPHACAAACRTFEAIQAALGPAPQSSSSSVFQ